MVKFDPNSNRAPEVVATLSNRYKTWYTFETHPKLAAERSRPPPGGRTVTSYMRVPTGLPCWPLALGTTRDDPQTCET